MKSYQDVTNENIIAISVVLIVILIMLWYYFG